MVSVVKEAISLEFSSPVQRSPWTKHTAQRPLKVMPNYSLTHVRVLASFPTDVSRLLLLYSRPLLLPAALVLCAHLSSSPPCQSATFLKPSPALKT